MTELCFARPQFSIEELINCLSHPKVDEATQNALPEQLRQTQKLTYDNVKDYLRNKAADDPGFPTRFLEYVTGTSYLASRNDTKIFVAFEQLTEDITQTEIVGTNRTLPKVWTCANWIGMPTEAYDGNYEDMARAMDKAMELVGMSFNMN